MERTWVFETKKIKKVIFTKTKKIIKIDDIDVNKTLVYKEEPYSSKNSFKCFIGYNDNDKVTRQCLLRLVTNNC